MDTSVQVEYQKRGLYMRLVSFIFALMLTVGTTYTWALTLSQVPLAEALRTANFVVIGKITNLETHFVGDAECGTKYTATISTVIKNDSQTFDNKEVSFGRFPGLSHGREYILLLNYVSNIEEIVEDVSALVPRPETHQHAIELVKCNGIVPGYYFNLNMAWEVVGDKVLIENRLPPDFLRSQARKRKQGSAVVWEVRKVRLLSYLRKLTSHTKR
jgi:hypothetical protein